RDRNVTGVQTCALPICQLQGAIVLLQRLIVPAEVMQCDPHPDGRARRLRQVPASLRNPEALYLELEAALGVAPTSLERPEGEERSEERRVGKGGGGGWE